MLTAVSLFAGVGGIDLALERAGVEVKAAVEIDEHARGVLADQFPKTTLFNDVTEVTGDDLRRAGFVPERGILTAGWPCQGNSVAGARGGMADPRSGLWRHVVRLNALRAGDGGSSRQSLIAETIRSHPRPGSNSLGGIVHDETTVRRLTPTECERLQGFPDGHTLTSNGKPQADSQRYKQMGNAVAVPVFEWVARRIVAFEERS
jgi:site-specific DNA-cytosine methylase